MWLGNISIILIGLLGLSSFSWGAESFEVALQKDPLDLWDQVVYQHDKSFRVYAQVQVDPRQKNWNCQIQSGKGYHPLVPDSEYFGLKPAPYPNIPNGILNLGEIREDQKVVCRARGPQGDKLTLKFFLDLKPFPKSVGEKEIDPRTKQVRVWIETLKTQPINEGLLQRLESDLFTLGFPSISSWEEVPVISIPTRNEASFRIQLSHGDLILFQSIAGKLALSGGRWSVGLEGMSPTQPLEPYHPSKNDLAFDSNKTHRSFGERPLQLICTFCSEDDLLLEAKNPKKNACRNVVFRAEANMKEPWKFQGAGELRCGFNNVLHFRHYLFQYPDPKLRPRILVTRGISSDLVQRLQQMIGEDGPENADSLMPVLKRALNQIVLEAGAKDRLSIFQQEASDLRMKRYSVIESRSRNSDSFYREQKLFEDQAFGINRGVSVFEFQKKGFRIDFKRKPIIQRNGSWVSPVSVKAVQEVYAERSHKVEDQYRVSAMHGIPTAPVYQTQKFGRSSPKKTVILTRYLCQSDVGFFIDRLRRKAVSDAFKLLENEEGFKSCHPSSRPQDRIMRRSYRNERLPWVLCFDHEERGVRMSDAYSTFIRESFDGKKSEFENSILKEVYVRHPYVTRQATWWKDLGSYLDQDLRSLFSSNSEKNEKDEDESGDSICGYFSKLLPHPSELKSNLKKESKLIESPEELELMQNLKEVFQSDEYEIEED